MHSGLLWQFGRLPLALQAQLLASRGRRTANDGGVVAWSAVGSMALALRFRAAQWLDLMCGAGAALGYARLQGTPNEESALMGRSVFGVFWGPSLSIGALVPVRTRWGLRAGIDLTYIVKPLRGLDSAGRTTYALEKLQLHATVAVVAGSDAGCQAWRMQACAPAYGWREGVVPFGREHRTLPLLAASESLTA